MLTQAWDRENIRVSDRIRTLLSSSARVFFHSSVGGHEFESCREIRLILSHACSKICSYHLLTELQIYLSFKYNFNTSFTHLVIAAIQWCFKIMKRRPCWFTKPILWEFNSFLMQTLSFVPMNLHGCWQRSICWIFSL